MQDPDRLFDIAFEAHISFPRVPACFVPELLAALAPELDDDERFHAVCQFDAIRAHVAQYN